MSLEEAINNMGLVPRIAGGIFTMLLPIGFYQAVGEYIKLRKVKKQKVDEHFQELQ